ncbi:hypothetical protein B0H67DRAFT_137781 [Lasiosphaeris hirsuta]|uniref:Uncharacterized protein n=1 Tax=Lasiosphaeris hirsuta TaxID=260670 RepID=A0AA40B116_9PEZI|nr:hypothetical protein B0H67DRAFT_137781 [Lasiosphaeris hirsuta]
MGKGRLRADLLAQTIGAEEFPLSRRKWERISKVLLRVCKQRACRAKSTHGTSGTTLCLFGSHLSSLSYSFQSRLTWNNLGGGWAPKLHKTQRGYHQQVNASCRALTASDATFEEPQKRRNGFRVADFDVPQTTLGSKSRHGRWSFCKCLPCLSSSFFLPIQVRLCCGVKCRSWGSYSVGASLSPLCREIFPVTHPMPTDPGRPPDDLLVYPVP